MVFRRRNFILRWFYRTAMKMYKKVPWENTETHKTGIMCGKFYWEELICFSLAFYTELAETIFIRLPFFR